MPFWYNPNIEPVEEHDKRQIEYLKFIDSKKYSDISTFNYLKENKEWHKVVDRMKEEPEGGKRCEKCIEFRLRKTAEYAKEHGIQLFSTTLSVSPHKSIRMIDDAGVKHSNTECQYEHFDFKKNNGYKLSIELSKELDLYRQNYCGCIYSMPPKK